MRWCTYRIVCSLSFAFIRMYGSSSIVEINQIFNYSEQYRYKNSLKQHYIELYQLISISRIETLQITRMMLISRNTTRLRIDHFGRDISGGYVYRNLEVNSNSCPAFNLISRISVNCNNIRISKIIKSSRPRESHQYETLQS